MFRKIIKKLNNFKFTATIVAIISAVAGLYSLGALFLYHFAGELDPQSKGLIRFTGFTEYFVKGANGVEKNIGPYLGMVLFFMALFTIFISIFIVYSLIPYIANKEKLSPRKGLLLTGFIGACFELVLVIFMIFLAAQKQEAVKTALGIWLTLPIGILSTIGTGLYLIPWLKCDFYMPEIIRK